MGLAPDTLTFDRANPLRSGESRWSTSSMTAPTMEPMMPLARSSRPSPAMRLESRPPTKEPTRPATKAIVQSMPLLPLPRMS